MDTETYQGGPIEDLLARYYELELAGERPDLEALTAKHPELRDELVRLVANERHHAELAERAIVPHVNDFALSAGTVIDGDYRIVAGCGSGGMGTVYVAEQISVSRTVALKVMATSGQLDGSAWDRFRREAEITASLDHQNIVPVYATGIEDGVAYLAMRLVDGPSLDEIAPMDAAAVARIGRDVASALDAVHAVGILHRDIKPANILLEDDVPVIVDFGLARADAFATLTRSGMAPGTLPYMAPEQFDRPSTDPRVDVYGIGATLYHLLSGRPPFSESTPSRLMRRILSEPPKSLVGVPRDLRVIIERAMDKEPARRFPTAAAMAEDLERYREGLPIVSCRAGIARRAALWVRRRKATVVCLAVILVTLISLFAAGAWMRADRDRRWQTAAAEVRAAVDAREFGRTRSAMLALTPEFSEDSRLVALRDFVDLHAELESIVWEVYADSPKEGWERLREIVASEPAFAELPSALFTLATGALRLGEKAKGEAWLARTEATGAFPKACAAIRTYLSGKNAWSEAQTVQSAVDASARQRSDDQFFFARALTAMGASVAMQDVELALAEELDPSNARPRFFHAQVMTGQHWSRAAYERFRSVADAMPPGLHSINEFLSTVAWNLAESASSGGASRSPEVDAWRARALEHLVDARAALGQRAAPKSLEIFALRILLHERDYAEFWRRWKELEPRIQQRDGSSDLFWSLAALVATLENRLPEAIVFQSKAVDCSQTSASKSQAQLNRIELQLRWTQEDAGARTDLIREVIAEATRIANENLRAPVNPPQALRAFRMATKGEYQLGNVEAARKLAATACMVGDEPSCLLVFGSAVANRARKLCLGETDEAEASEDSKSPLGELTELADVRLRRSLAMGSLEPHQIVEAQKSRYWLACVRGDASTMMSLAKELLARDDCSESMRAHFDHVVRYGIPPMDRIVLSQYDESIPRSQGPRLLDSALTELIARRDAGALEPDRLREMSRAWLDAEALASVRDESALERMDSVTESRWRELWMRVRVAASR
ncbi:MAG: serine/threonine protein kinase [Planctomycetes bacterium]|nr:serine/threonine protein kinase [Planctomycetota bacterium]